MDDVYYIKIRENINNDKWYSEKSGELFEVYEFGGNLYTIDDHLQVDLWDCELIDNTYLFNEMMKNRKEINYLKATIEKLLENKD